MKINYELLAKLREVRSKFWIEPTKMQLEKKIAKQAIYYTVYPN